MGCGKIKNMIQFNANTHSYISPGEDIKWTSVTSLISKFKQPFDSKAIATKCSRNKKSKWYGLSVAEIESLWDGERLRSTDLGTWYHNKREYDLLNGVNDECVIMPHYYDEAGNKITESTNIDQDGIYPELLIYNKNLKICGQADYVEVTKGVVNIRDFKTSKEISKTSFTNWEGISKKMLPPLMHLDDANLNHYALQLSIYMYIIIKNNPHLTAGKLIIEHIKFKKERDDEYGYPVYEKDEQGDYIVEDIIEYDVPYLKNEVKKIIEHIKC